MGKCRFMWTNLWDTGTLTQSSENPNFPAINIRHRWHEKIWRSTGVNQEWLKVDLGSAKQASVIVIKKHNFSSGAYVAIWANSIDDWVAPPFVMSIPRSTDIMIGFFPSAKTYQWWLLWMVNIGNPAGYLEIGRVFLGQYFEPARNFARERDHEPIDPSLLNESEGGQESSIIRTQYNLKNYNFLDTRQKTNFDNIFASRGLKKDLFFCEDSDNPQPYTIYCRIANFKWKHNFLDRWHLNMALKELL